MKILGFVKDGLIMGKDKVVGTIVNIGAALKDKQNRIVAGIILVGLGGGLIVSGYIKMPQ